MDYSLLWKAILFGIVVGVLINLLPRYVQRVGKHLQLGRFEAFLEIMKITEKLRKEKQDGKRTDKKEG
jgi:hypothetical protein